MLVITVYGEGDKQQFLAHQVNQATGEAKDVTAEYSLRALTVQDPEGYFAGYHFGRRLRPDEVLQIESEARSSEGVEL